jgi:hypothetical protein
MNRIFACASVFMLLLHTGATNAGTVFAEAGDPLQVGIPSGTGTLDLRAHAEEPPLRANATHFDTVIGGPAALFTGSIGGVFFGYSPIVGFSGPKGAQRTIRSQSGGASATATFVPPATIPGFPSGLLLASASVGAVPGSTAAAEAKDPYPVFPGVYNYTAVIEEFTLLLGQDERGGGSYFATDSRFAEFLWRLAIGSPVGGITDLSDVFVDFTSNAILGLNDELIESAVRSAISLSSGLAQLTSFELFSTTYVVDQPILYGFGAEADLLRVPEPTSVALLTLAFLSLVWKLLCQPAAHRRWNGQKAPEAGHQQRFCMS